MFSKKEFKHLIKEFCSISAPCDDVSIMKYLADYSGKTESLTDLLIQYNLPENTPAYSLFCAYNILKAKLKDEEQEKLYNEYKKVSIEYADTLCSRPGHSEHQTGLVLDLVSTKNQTLTKFIESEEYKWLVNNAHKYGFIIRYPQDKYKITGYKSETNHLRYVGKEFATTLYNEQITLDEYIHLTEEEKTRKLFLTLNNKYLNRHFITEDILPYVGDLKFALAIELSNKEYQDFINYIDNFELFQNTYSPLIMYKTYDTNEYSAIGYDDKWGYYYAYSNQRIYLLNNNLDLVKDIKEDLDETIKKSKSTIIFSLNS